MQSENNLTTKLELWDGDKTLTKVVTGLLVLKKGQLMSVDVLKDEGIPIKSGRYKVTEIKKPILYVTGSENSSCDYIQRYELELHEAD
jgi:hypothetical protein